MLGMLRNGKRLFSGWLLLAAFGLILLLILLLPLHALALSPEERQLTEAQAAGQIIRLHILAEDDTPRAQALKLMVRDSLLAAFGQELSCTGVQDAAEAYSLLCRKRDAMLAVARQTACSYGFCGQITAETGLLQLPEKTYGSVTLPAGEYYGLRITIGAGAGRNWWCILFPQLCLAAASEEPWQTASGASEPRPMKWNSLEILQQWTLLPPVPSDPAKQQSSTEDLTPLPPADASSCQPRPSSHRSRPHGSRTRCPWGFAHLRRSCSRSVR